jgi:hypothetical protein
VACLPVGGNVMKLKWIDCGSKMIAHGSASHKIWPAHGEPGFYAKSGMDVHGPYRTALEACIVCGEIETPEQWQTMDTAPKDGTMVLLFVPDFHKVVTAWFCKATGLWPADEPVNEGGEACNVGLPTHWMPLPGPPKEYL